MSFWSGKKVFITGHTGFKGSWLSLWLTQMGAEVTGYALPAPTRPSLFEAARLGSLLSHVEGDIRDADHLAASMAAARPDVVLHLAAQALVRPSYVDPVGTWSTNVMGTVHVLEAVRRAGSVRVALMVTSDKCYENREWPWGYRETEAMGGFDPYSSSKGAAELATAAWRRSFLSSEVAVASARAGNVIGGGDWALDRLIPDMVGALARAEVPVIRSPGATRPWQHVLDPLAGYMMLCEKLWAEPERHAGGWNFGPSDDDARPVSWIADRLCAVWGDGARWQLDRQGQHPHEAHFLKLDCSKARSDLGWRPRWALDEVLVRVAEWYKAFAAGADARALCLDHIALFQDAA